MYRVLIVDDEPPYVRQLGKLLLMTGEEKDFYIDTAYNGFKAEELLARGPYDLVITDIRMAGKTGLELLEHIYHDFPYTSVIIVSGYSDFTYAQTAVKYRAAEYLLKPIDPDDFALAVERALGHVIDQRKQALSDLLFRNPDCKREAIPFLREKLFVLGVARGVVRGTSAFPVPRGGLHTLFRSRLLTVLRELYGSSRFVLNTVNPDQWCCVLIGVDDPPLLLSVVEYIEKNIAAPLALNETARHFFISQPALSRLLRDGTGFSFNEFVTRERMLLATRMILRDPELRLNTVAQETGYPDQHYFSRIFKETFGCSPQEFQSWLTKGFIRR